MLLAGLWREGPVQYWSVWLVKHLCVYYYWDVLWWRTTKAVLFSLKLHFNPSERLIVWGVRLVPGLEGSQVWLEPAWHPTAARIRCIKNICGHSEPPQHEQRACRDWLLWLSSSPSFRRKYKALIANPKCCFAFLSWCIKTVKYCSHFVQHFSLSMSSV